MPRLAVTLAALCLTAQNPIAQPTPLVTRIAGWTTTPDRAPLAGVEVALACPPQPVRRTMVDGDIANLIVRVMLKGAPAARPAAVPSAPRPGVDWP
jgi:hypothetical protein